MVLEMYEPCRAVKRVFDGYVSSRKAFLIVVVVMALLLYVGPSIFHWLMRKAPKLTNPNIGCVESLMQTYLQASYVFDGTVSRTYDSEGSNYFPYVGNGKIGIPISGSEATYFFYKRSLSLPFNYSPIVNVDLPGAKSEGGIAVLYTNGIAYKFTCFNVERVPVSVVQQFYAYRVIPSVFIQEIEIKNPSNQDITLNFHQNIIELEERNIPLRQPNGEVFSYRQFFGDLSVPETKQKIVVSFSAAKVPHSVVINKKSSKTFTFHSVVHYSDPLPSSQHKTASEKLDTLTRKDLQRVLDTSILELKRRHVEVWQKLWHSGFSISISRAKGALNGDKINSTLYYVLSNSREYMSELDTTPQQLQALQNYLYSPDKCYSGHHTLQASTLWSDLQSVNDVNKVVSLWLLTLYKQGCHNLLLAGATGVMQAMILSFGGFKFSNHHLEFDCDPKDLHRDYHFRRIIYGDSTHVNISVKVQEDNKAVIYSALDRSDKDYYACDGGCLDPPVKLGSEPVSLPVKLTSPMTAILYITSDKQHMEDLKHTIHVKEIMEAPAHEHHVIALHRHGHQLGGLPAFFWVSVAFLIAVFHLFLIKLVYNEYCGNQEKPRKRYIV